MKKNNEIFEKNIEKLMKLNGNNDQPSEAFVEKLIDDAMDQLTTPQENRKPNTRRATMKLTFKRTAAIAAALIVAASIFSIFKPDMTDVKNIKQGIAIVDNNIELVDELVPIPLVLPNAILSGTPINVSGIENLEKPLGRPRPLFLAPTGTTNVALGKPVSSTDEHPIGGTLASITDGDKEGADGSWIELGIFEQHVTIDLGAKYEIYAIVGWHYHKQMRVYYDVIVQVADDPDFIMNVVTLFNNDHDNTFGLGVGEDMNYIETNEGKLIDAKGTQARYVRMYSCGNIENELNHYIEIEVYGKPIDDQKSDNDTSKVEKPDIDKGKLVPIPVELPNQIAH